MEIRRRRRCRWKRKKQTKNNLFWSRTLSFFQFFFFFSPVLYVRKYIQWRQLPRPSSQRWKRPTCQHNSRPPLSFLFFVVFSFLWSAIFPPCRVRHHIARPSREKKNKFLFIDDNHNKSGAGSLFYLFFGPFHSYSLLSSFLLLLYIFLSYFLLLETYKCVRIRLPCTYTVYRERTGEDRRRLILFAQNVGSCQRRLFPIIFSFPDGSIFHAPVRQSCCVIYHSSD